MVPSYECYPIRIYYLPLHCLLVKLGPYPCSHGQFKCYLLKYAIVNVHNVLKDFLAKYMQVNKLLPSGQVEVEMSRQSKIIYQQNLQEISSSSLDNHHRL